MKDFRIIYIAGYGRSGSTILDVAFSQHNQVLGLGEITNIFEEWDSLSEDKFWSSLILEIKQAFPDLSPKYFTSITKRMQAIPQWLVHKKKRSDYFAVWNLIFDFLQRKGFSVLIDSSKTTRLSLYRPYRLQAMGFSVELILLRRSFGKIWKSAAKGSNRALEKKKSKTKSWQTLFKTFFGYYYTMVSTLVLYGKMLRINLSYDDFIEDPAGVLNRVMIKAGLEIRYTNKQLRAQLDPGVGISGNRLRRQKIDGIKQKQ